MDDAVPPLRSGSDDVSTLAWVQGELRRSLEAAHKSLRRHLKEAEAHSGSDVDAVDPSVLRAARAQLHQGLGALELVGQGAAAQLLRASEAAVSKLAAKPGQVNEKAVETIERASFALLDYLARIVAGKPLSAVALFPQYREVQALAGAERAHPADLWETDWSWRELPHEAVPPRAADEAAKDEMETLVLTLMRQPQAATLAQASDLCAGLAAGSSGRQAALWQLAAAFFEGQARGLVPFDVHTKRVASGVLAQLRGLSRGQAEPSPRLAADLLFFVAHARPPAGNAPRMSAAREGWQLASAATDYDTPRLGRFDPALIAQARKRVTSARDTWSAVAGAEMHRLPQLGEQFALVGESVTRLFPEGQVLAAALQSAANRAMKAGAAPEPTLAMEVATAILYLDACLEDADLDHPELGARVRRLAERIEQVRSGEEPKALEPWMEELYRRVSDRQTMGSVVQELRNALSEAEKQIDLYFRDPAQRQLLLQVPDQLKAMRGVLSVLDMRQASQAVVHMQGDVDRLAVTEGDPRSAVPGCIERLADNLGALSFLIDMLAVQPALAKSLFRFDAASGRLSAVMGQAERDAAAAAEAALGEPAPAAQAMPAGAAAPAPTPATVSGLEDDAEMREIFIEEAREVIAGARESLERLGDSPEDLAELTSVRRAFHTLKGSSRMVGLRDFGEAGWSCEQLYNARLAQAPRMDAPLRAVTTEALDYLGTWVDAIADGRNAGHDPVAVGRAADAMRLENRRIAIGAPGAPLGAPAAIDATAPDALLPEDPAAGPSPLPFEPDPAPLGVEATLPLPAGVDPAALAAHVPGLPSAADLDLGDSSEPLVTLEFDFPLDEVAAVAETVEAAPALEPDAAEPGIETSEFDLAAFAETAPPAGTPVASVPVDPAFDLPLDAPPPLVVEPEAVLEPEPLPAEPEPEAEREDEQVKVIGPLRIAIPLFNIYLNEADEVSRRLGTELAEWSVEHDHHPVPETAVGLAHQLAGNSSTVGFADLSALARTLEHALVRSHARGPGSVGEAELFNDVAEEIRRLLHQFAAGFLPTVAPLLVERLGEHEHEPERARAPVPAAPASDFAPLADLPAQPAVAVEAGDDIGADDIDAVDAVDPELFPIFEEEAEELLPELQGRLREWARQPDSREAAAACMRTLHTFKGGARLAGAMRIGELAHRLETAIEHLLARERADRAEVESLIGRADGIAAAFEALRNPALAAALPERLPEPAAPAIPPPVMPAPVAAAPAGPATRAGAASAAIDWNRFTLGTGGAAAPAERPAAAANALVRVRSQLLDRLVNSAGEVSIARARIGNDVQQLQSALGELTDSLERLRRQLRDIELQAETQLASRLEQAKAQSEGFDPLEMDRFTRFQELTRFMAESVNDVATLQRGLQRTLQSAEDELAAQARLTRDLQDDLLRTRMVEFESLSERLYRVVRQAGKETGKQVRLDLVGGAIEIDRGVLERMTGPFEHLLRNSVAHGIESSEERLAAGKEAAGTITISVTQEGNEVGVDVRDDGAGLNLAKIRARGIERGLVAADAPVSDGEIAQLIFSPGFSTAESVTELAGRGVGMDVVRAEVNAMGGRIVTSSTPGKGTSFKLLLPLTTAVTQVVMLRCGEMHVAVPATLVEIVRRAKPDEVERGYSSGHYDFAGEAVAFHWLGALLQQPTLRGPSSGRSQPVAVIRSASQRVALHVEDIVGNQEVVVKNVGPQLARLPGLVGVTLLPSGQVALIYNPVALATLYGQEARERLLEAERPAPAGRPVAEAGDLPAGDAAALFPPPAAAAEPAAPTTPLVLVVDDSLTVRRVTQRLLAREGYRVALAKDGLDAIEKLAEERPAVMLSDIEMPRMDGFDLARNVRANPALAGLPIIMITSRIARKHRDYAAELGVDHYLGKPFAEDELLALIAGYAGAHAAT